MVLPQASAAATTLTFRCLSVGTRPPPRSRKVDRQLNSMPPHHYTCSTAPELHTSILPRLSACSAPPDLNTSMPPRLHGSSGVGDTSIPRLQRTSRAPELHASILPRLHACSEPSELQDSMPPYVQVATPTARLLERYTPPPLHRYTNIETPELHASLHFTTRVASLQSS